MKKQSKNTYQGGLNQDNSRSKYSPDTYYDALNIKVITDSGLASLSIENEKGNKLLLTFPDIPLNFPGVTEYKDGTARSTQAINSDNLKIVGHALLDNNICIFTTTSDSEDPQEILSQIWYVSFDGELEGIEGSVNQVISLNDLKYNDTLNLSTAYRIEAKSRNENSKTKNLYFTDNYNNFKSINIGLDKEDLALIKPGNLDINQDVSFSLPVIEDILPGNLPVASSVQIAYRLVNQGSGSSAYSFPTNPINLSVFDIKQESVARKIKGSASNSANNKAIKYRIDNIDTNFDIIEHIAILYIDKDSPTIFKFKEEFVPSNGSLTNVLDGTEQQQIIDNTEFNAVSFGFDTCKTIDIIQNVLVAGNLKTASFNVTDEEFDARAYRFNSNSQALLKDDDLGDITLTTPNPDYDSVPEKHDCINSFNTQKGVNETVQDYDEYMYQSNGTTLGGEGKQISYTFATKFLQGDELSKINTSGTNHLDITKRQSILIDHNVKDANNDAITVTVDNQYENYKSHIVQHYYTGYMRGEIYRFGIQFIDKKGKPSFVKWIGDIKFPEHEDSNGFYNLHLDVSNTTSLKALGIEFKVSIPQELKNKISAYKIVRVERKALDESRLGSAPVMLWARHNVPADGTGTSVINGSGTYPGEHPLLDLKAETAISENVGSNNVFYLPDRGITSGSPIGESYYRSSMRFSMWLSPLLQYGKYYKNGNFINNSINDFLKTNCFVEASAAEYRGMAPSNSDKIQLWRYRLKGVQNINTLNGNTEETFKIENLFFMDSSKTQPKVFNDSGLALNGYAYANDKNPNQGTTSSNDYITFPNRLIFFNSGYRINTSTNGAGIQSPFVGNNQNLIACIDDPNHLNIDDNPQNNWNSFTISNVVASASGTFSQGHLFKEVSYCRKLNNQYGGNTFEARANQRYISTGHFQIMNSNIDNLESFEVWGGDTFVNYNSHEYLQPSAGSTREFDARFAFENIDIDTILKEDNIDRKANGMSIAVIYPCESTINTDLNLGEFQFLSDREGFSSGTPQIRLVSDEVTVTGGDTSLKHDFVLNEVYYQKNNISTRQITRDFIGDFIEEYPNRLWPSQRKIDGEFIDSFRIFKDLEFLDVDGNRGGVNKVINFNDKLVFFQDTSFGIGNVNERSIIRDEDGLELVLGKGQQTLDYYKYLSNRSGTKHQFSVNNSESSIYYFDSLQNKMMSFSGQGSNPLSVMKGVQSYLINNIDNSIINVDKTLLNRGVHTGIDLRHNRVFFTFLQENNSFTISFSEKLNSFESFYSFIPIQYITYNNTLLSNSINTENKLYVHERGDYGEFYDGDVEDSYIVLLFNDNPDLIKIFNNIFFNSEVKDINGDDIFNVTLDNLEFYNDYQTTGDIQLVVNQNIKRRMRMWRHQIPRDVNSQNQKARMRDYYIFGKFTFDNTNNNRLILHDVIMSYNISIH